MRISQLYNDGPLTGQDVHIVGTGSSMTVFPVEFLRGRTCVLLNDASRWLPDLGPVAFSNTKKFLKHSGHLPYLCVKGRNKDDPHREREDNHMPWNDARHYVFSYREDRPEYGAPDNCSHFDWSRLWLERDFYVNEIGGCCGIFCLQFVLQCKPKSVTLVGCDCCDIAGEEYLSPKPTRNARHKYSAYAAGTVRLIREARERFGIPVVSLSPFAGLGRHEEQFQEMRGWQSRTTTRV